MLKLGVTKAAMFFATGVFLASCEGAFIGENDKSVDLGLDAKPLRELKAGIWIDPNGCDHWIVDDGLEGYLSQRLDRDGKPVCSGTALANTTIGDFKRGSSVIDLF